MKISLHWHIATLLAGLLSGGISHAQESSQPAPVERCGNAPINHYQQAIERANCEFMVISTVCFTADSPISRWTEVARENDTWIVKHLSTDTKCKPVVAVMRGSDGGLVRMTY